MLRVGWTFVDFARLTCNVCYEYTIRLKLLQIDTVKILNFRTDTIRQTVQTQIRLLLEEQLDQGLHCLLFHLHHLEVKHQGRTA